ncbi:MAG: AAA family ATPase [Isosphaeraceae bacterium]
MKDLIRTVVVDPHPESRAEVKRILSSVGSFWVAEVLETYRESPARIEAISPDLTVVVLDHDPQQAIDAIAAVIQANPRAIVLPASRNCDSGLILRAIRAGAREFLTLPAEPAEWVEVTGRLLRGREATPVDASRDRRVIAVTGAAGGVGVTSVAVNLAASLASARQHETVLLDFDMIFGSVDAALDIVTENTVFTVLQNLERLDATLLRRSTTQHASGLHVLPRPTAIEEAARIDPEALQRLLCMVRASFGTVVIDTSKGLQATDFAAMEIADTILVVAQLDLSCLRNTARMIGLLQQFEGLADRIKLIVNRAGSTENEISQAKAEETLKLPISWQIPNATKIFQAARIKGTPLADVAKGSRPHQVFLEMARALRPAAEEPARQRKGLFAALF